MGKGQGQMDENIQNYQERESFQCFDNTKCTFIMSILLQMQLLVHSRLGIDG